METKQSNWTTVNIMACRKLKRETEKAVLFSIPKHKGLSVWINKKCVHGSRNGKMFVVCIKADDEYTIWIYDADSNRHLKRLLFIKITFNAPQTTIFYRKVGV